MKRFLCLLFVFLLPVVSYADGFPDLSVYSFEELLRFRVYLNYSIWQTEEWQEVTVSPGVWEIGTDIPAGHWSVRPSEGCGPSYIVYASSTKDQGHDVELIPGEYIMECICDSSSPFYSAEYKKTTDFIMETGHFVSLGCSMIFSPYSGKPDFGFR